MAITFGVMVPHPPIILPEVGKGEERKITATKKQDVIAAELSGTTITLTIAAVVWNLAV